MTTRGGLWIGLAVSLLCCALSCGSPVKGDPTVELRVSPTPLSEGQSARVQATATAGDGRVGTGRVVISSDRGSLVAGVELPLDGFGTATADFQCDAPCTSPVQFKAVWQTATDTLNVETSSGIIAQESCVVGTVTSQATANNLSLFGTPVYFQNGAALPAGTYRLKNNGGCIRYGTGQNWTVNAYANGDVSWWIIGESSATQVTIPPGTVGFERVPGGADRDVGSFTDFNQCDTANQALPPKDFAFTGGKMGIWLKDDIYADNTAGLGGKNPSWTLSRVTSACP